MGWKDLVDKIKLADIQGSLKIGQGGIVNVKVENNYYHFHFPDTDAVEKFKQTKVTPDLEKAVKDDVTQHLDNVGPSLDLVSGSTMQEVVSATTVTSAFNFVKKQKL